ncbi:hypothetical protein Ddye_026372 [Dipteronia dyeriana]|uniref:CCHC-type domain-containing protein n=1 Tax=Dipteronia dyeriana TaxID=168575 RepID=A0AAD9TML8_9ROSI|nr:hypothetical protein Ddye_026372 [Dipteronia dyeriana]
MTKEIVTSLGEMIWEVHDFDNGITTDISGRYLRVRIMVSVDRPLLRSLWVDLLWDGNISTMLLQYERILDYCFKCGCLGHVLDECTEEVNVRYFSSEANRRLRAWLCAVSPPKRSFIDLEDRKRESGTSQSLMEA